MSTTTKISPISIGFAMFAMFFGAGNVIFPLVVGQYASSHNFFAIIGLILTAVVMPFAGVYAMILYDGDYKKFFGKIGRIPGFLMALTILLLLGPFGSVPRCVALSYSTLKSVFPMISSVPFSAIACLVIFGLTVRKNRIIDLLGKVLTPLLLGTLFIIIIKGLLTPTDMPTTENEHNLFLYGVKEGYKTMDLMAAFFFSSAIVTIIKQNQNNQNYVGLAVKASLIGAALLSIVYIGFSYIAAFHAHSLNINGNDELLSALTLKIAGSSAGLLACVTIALACLTTAIALSSVFADFVQKEVCREKISYEWVLALSLLVTFFVSTFEFSGISTFLEPILDVCYPFLIVLTIVNILHAKWKAYSCNSLSSCIPKDAAVER